MVPFLLVLVAWGAAGLSCVRLCLAGARLARQPAGAAAQGARFSAYRRELTLYEAAFLAGGPRRVADLALVSMHLRRRLLLAPTGWATVVDPEGRDEVERTVIRAIGPEGQSPIPPVRAAAAAADAVRAVADRLVAAGLAVPRGADMASAVRAVRGTAGLVAALGAAALLAPGGPETRLLVWFGLPLALTLGCLAIARLEAHPYGTWASPAGQRMLEACALPGDGATGDTLVAVAVRGVGAVRDPALRAALAGREGVRGRPARE
ncbi:TIGR04222 domain-containing membrane protein [Streptomyces castrisilvae]|uniref:TIGR04222 domain-containing membrane protein n=1 Tax=Streptomyces castrisilvae TaxID=3033811 RepID=A0ABY9HSH1_9ACTN|nr:TIGR04222 domain-containing membrane protein [Streptomyces sp. Mut1]WLQ36943.1 TIGR04222 domain-containing membrane protein [Streptomyces sp. Mut1]